MNNTILSPIIQNFIKNYSGDISKLAFAGSPFENVTTQELMQQIESRNRIEKKLPTWFTSEQIYYPKKLNLEQTSSEATASYKATLVNGKLLADISGGFGVDAYYFSKNIDSVHHFEHDLELSEIAAHNFKVLNKNNILCFAADGLVDALKNAYDIIYADPSRRHDVKGKVFFLKDCEPNIPENLSALLNQCEVLMLKTSPMLDLTVGLNELKLVYQLHIIAIDNEVKELVWLLKKDFTGIPKIYTINISKVSSEKFDFNINENGSPTFGVPNKFLYEPNAAIMKSGAFDLISEVFKVEKLHLNTHLYTSHTLLDFPGRRFYINKVIKYSKSSLRKELALKKANIATRNFPESVASLRKKWNIKEGGDIYLFYTTIDIDQKVVLMCSKIESKGFNN